MRSGCIHTQPFIENAVKYAFLEKEGTCSLTVEAKLLGEQLIL